MQSLTLLCGMSVVEDEAGASRKLSSDSSKNCVRKDWRIRVGLGLAQTKIVAFTLTHFVAGLFKDRAFRSYQFISMRD